MNMWLRRCLKLGLFLRPWGRRSGQTSPSADQVTFLIYHSVGGNLPVELDLPLPLFRRQLAYLARTWRVIAYDQALAGLTGNAPLPEGACVLTFDDGYRNFYTHVFPLLEEFQVPAMLFVSTGFVENGGPSPLRSLPSARVQPVTWEMLGVMADSGLVTLGAHTHTHPVLTGLAQDRVEEELTKPLALFQRRLGLQPEHFAYPGAIWSPAVEARVAAYYRSAVIGEGRPATRPGFHPYRIPRLPIRRSDGWAFFVAKMAGRLQGEEAVYARLRGLWLELFSG